MFEKLGLSFSPISGFHAACRMTLLGLLISLEEAVIGRSLFSDLVHTIVHAASEGKKEKTPPLGAVTSSGFHISSLQGIVLCIFAALPPPSPLPLFICRNTDEDSMAFMGQRKERSVKALQLNNIL